MPIGKADYQIEIRSTADNAAFEATTEAEKKLGAAAEGAGISHHQLHAALALLRLDTEGALGPIGELLHLMSNPYVLAVGGLSMAYHLLQERRKEDIENMEKQITLTQEMTASFHDSHIKAVLDAAEALSKYNIELKHAHDGIDYVTEALKRQEAAATQQTSALDGQGSATLSLWEANIKLAKAEGKIDAPTADEMTRHAKDQERTQKEKAAYDAAQADIDAKTQSGLDAIGLSNDAKNKILGLRKDREHQNELGLDAEGAVGRAKAALDEANALAAKALAKVNVDANSLTGASMKDYEDRDNTDADAKRAQAQYDLAQKNAEKQKEALAEIDANIEQQRKIAATNEDLANTLIQQAHEQKKALDRLQKSNAANDAIDKQAETTNALTALVTAMNNGTATPGQKSEFAGSQTPPTTQMLKDIFARATAVGKEANGPQKKADEEELFGRIMGVLDYLTLHPGIRNAAAMQRQLNQMEQRLNLSGNVR